VGQRPIDIPYHILYILLMFQEALADYGYQTPPAANDNATDVPWKWYVFLGSERLPHNGFVVQAKDIAEACAEMRVYNSPFSVIEFDSFWVTLNHYYLENNQYHKIGY
jgi:hypothetical protein